MSVRLRTARSLEGFANRTEVGMGREVLGEFEHQVLLAILRLGRESYSVPIVTELEARTGREIGQSAVFVALRRLEKKGMLASRMDDHAKAETGRVRRYFALTPEALEKLRESRRVLESLWDGMQAELDRS
jgi:DNA-binding PadR family transcriptional regulator